MRPNNNNSSPVIYNSSVWPKSPLFPYYVCVFGGVAMVLNVVTILAVIRVRGRLPSNIRLVCGLIASDFLTALLYTMDMLLDYHHKKGQLLHMDSCLNIALYSLKQMSHNVGLLTLVSLAVDLHVAIVLPLSYSKYMSQERMNHILLLVWAVSLLLGCSNLYLPMRSSCQKTYASFSFCVSSLTCRQSHAGILTVGVVLLSCVLMVIIYMHIFCQIRRFHRGTSTVVSGSTRRNRRGLATTLFILACFLVCYSPSYLLHFRNLVSLVYTDTTFKDISSPNFFIGLHVLVIVNSIFDPLLYAYRMRDIRMGYKTLFYWDRWAKFVCCCCFKPRARPTPLSFRQWPPSNSWSSHYRPRHKGNGTAQSPSVSTSLSASASSGRPPGSSSFFPHTRPLPCVPDSEPSGAPLCALMKAATTDSEDAVALLEGPDGSAYSVISSPDEQLLTSFISQPPLGASKPRSHSVALPTKAANGMGASDDEKPFISQLSHSAVATRCNDLRVSLDGDDVPFLRP